MWTDIVNYTVFGPHFWDGKGYGICLANDDGYQVGADNSLRSPHNGHLTILARSGVPGFVLWATLQGSWFVAILRSVVSSHRLKRSNWCALFAFLLSYWMAFMVNISFDVFIEGPMGGVWFWSVFGVGIAAVEVYRVRPDVLPSGPESAKDRKSIVSSRLGGREWSRALNRGQRAPLRRKITRKIHMRDVRKHI